MLKFMWKCKGPRVSKKQFWGGKNEQSGRISFPDFKTYCEAIVIKTGWY